MKIRLLVILLCCSCLYFKTNAQIQILFQSDQTKSFLLAYASSYESSQQVINEMIEGIAKFIPKPVYQTKITLKVDESIRVTRNQSIVSIYVTYQDMVMSGDVFYKGFNMTDVLLPSKYEFKAALYRKDGSLVKEFNQLPANFTPPFSETLLQCNDTALATNYNFVVTSIKFYYDQASRNRFHGKASLVDQYFMADFDLSNISKQLSEINPDDFENLEKLQADINKCKDAKDNIAGAAFWQALHTETYDPLKLGPKLYEVRKKYNGIQDQLNYTKSIIHELYYNKGLDLYNKKKSFDAKTAFEKSLSYQPSYAPSQYFLAQIAFETNKTEDARQMIKKLFTFYDIDNNTRKSALNLVSTIEWSDMNVAAGLLTGGKYTEALNAVDKAESFCQSIPGYICNDTINLIRRDSYRGIYANYIKSANSLFIAKNYKEAGNEVMKAIFFQEKYPEFIPGNEDALALKQKIGVEEYYQSLTIGKEKMVAKDYRAAFDEFDNASKLENDYPVKKDRLLPELIKKSKLEVLFLVIDDAEKKVSDNNLVKARSIMRQVIDDQRAYGLFDNSTLSAEVEKLKKSIFSQECMNAQKDYDTQVNAAIKAETEKNFILAENGYNNAIHAVEKNQDCDISSEIAKKGLQGVEKPSHYQQSFNQCNDFVKNRDYYKAVDTYNKLTNYYNNNSISDYGITHQPLYLYIASYESGFVTYGLTWLIDAGETDNAMYLLKVLKQRSIIKSTTKAQQTSLARLYAIRDHKNNVTNPKLKVTEYALGDSWFSYFSKEYLRQMKKLK